jgi:trafficking protein particle complex subunit 2
VLPHSRALLTHSAQGEAFLGVLGPADEYLVYGYVSCTRTKFFFVLDEELREADVRDAFKHLHAAYVDAVSNPFAAASTPLCSRSFERAARGIRDSLGRKRLV